jgi:hypothetical protein
VGVLVWQQDCEQYFLAVRACAKDHKKRDGSRVALSRTRTAVPVENERTDAIPNIHSNRA